MPILAIKKEAFPLVSAHLNVILYYRIVWIQSIYSRKGD